MADSVIFPETYRNCFKIPHYICSIIICVFFYIIAITAFCLSVFGTKYVDIIYDVGGYPTKILTCGCIISVILALTNSFLAFGVAKDWALFLLVWVIISIILWNLHLILLVVSFVFLQMRKNRKARDYISIVILFILQVVWLLLIIMIGRHWYAICEEMYQQEYGQLPRGVNRRMYTISNRSRMSHYSTRIPTVLHRIDRDHRR